jgi:TonB family protein
MLLVYMLLLRNRTVFRFNRLYLLASAVLPLVLPLIRLPNAITDRVQSISVLQFTLPEVVVGGSADHLPGLSIAAITTMVYIGVALAILALFGWNLYRMWKIVRNSAGQSKDGYVLLSNSGYGPGSFGRYIFFPDTEINQAILEHEKAHIQLHHTRDLVLLNLLQALAWPSLLLGLVKKQLREVHEFQADAMANEDKQSYAELLLSATLNVRALPEMHLFIVHPLKRRIMMLQKNIKLSQLKMGLLLTSITLFLGTTVLLVQGCSKTSTKNQDATVSGKEINNGMVKTGRKILFGGREFDEIDSVKKVADVMPESSVELVPFLVKNMHYPEYAKKHNIEGRVMVKFVVGTDGAILNPQVLTSPDTSITRAALDVIHKMPNWQPGRMADGRLVNVEMYLPIVFKLK